MRSGVAGASRCTGTLWPALALTASLMAKNADKLEKKVYSVPVDIDNEIARLKLEAMGTKIDILTPEQTHYLSSWEEGT